MLFDPVWIVLIIVSTGIGFATQSHINRTFRKWSQVPLGNGMTGAEVARRVLDANSLGQVPINAVAGQLTDHYDPRSKTLALSKPVFGESTVAAAGVAAHEAGHAIQDEQRYVWGSLRTAIVPVVSIGSQFAFPAILLGLWLQPHAARVARRDLLRRCRAVPDRDAARSSSTRLAGRSLPSRAQHRCRPSSWRALGRC